jgi:hypothetical protein
MYLEKPKQYIIWNGGSIIFPNFEKETELNYLFMEKHADPQSDQP